MNTHINPLRRACFSALALGAVLGLLPSASRAQTNVWHDDFDQQPVGVNSFDATYGRIAYNFSGTGVGNPIVVITNSANPDTLSPTPGYTLTNYCAFIFTSTNTTPPLPLNFGWDIDSVAAHGNTNTALRAYALSFDIAVQGDGMNALGGFVGPVLYVFGHNTPGAYSSGEYYGNGAQTNIFAGWFPAPGTGWEHVVMPMGSFGTANANSLITTNAAFSFGIGAYMAGLTSVNPQEVDIANVSITMSNPPPPPPPSMRIYPATPALRVFAQDHTATYNQEGFSTMDVQQSWVGQSTPGNPVTYSVTIADFKTVNNYTLYVQFVQNGTAGNPYAVYNGANALVWSITANTSGFTTAVNWKTNAPTGNENNNAISLTTGSTNGVGTWTLAFTDDMDGTITAPDGTTGAFSIDPGATTDFANPVVIAFGTAPNSSAGYGQFIDFSNIGITNVLDGNEYDDFTQDAGFNTTLWNSGFSLNNNPPSVIQVPPGNNYWVTWSAPADGYGIETKASLTGGTNMWFSPNYYGNGIFTNSIPTLMGGSTNWTLIPEGTLPSVDGVPGDPAGSTAFFRLSNPPPAQ